MTALEIRLALYAGLLAAVAIGALWLRHEGAVACERADKTAELAQAQRDHDIDQGTIHDLQQKLEALSQQGVPTDRPAPTLRVCIPTSYASRGPAPAGARPGPVPAAGSDTGVPGGAPSATALDVGPVLQDLASAGVLLATDNAELWNRAVKESQK